MARLLLERGDAPESHQYATLMALVAIVAIVAVVVLVMIGMR